MNGSLKSGLEDLGSATVKGLIRTITFGFLVVFIALSLLVSGPLFMTFMKSLQNTAQTVGSVDAVSEPRGLSLSLLDSGGRVSCEMTYSFTVNEKSYMGTSTLASADYCHMKKSDPVGVRYHTANPENNMTHDMVRSPLFLWGAVYFCIVTVALTIWTVWFVRRHGVTWRRSA